MADRAAIDKEPGAGRSPAAKAAILFCVAIVSLFLVAFFGWYQFSHQTKRPIEIVKQHPIPGTDLTIAEGINGFIKRKGLKIAQDGFRPRWGAEETARNVFTVSYVYEVVRDAHWISWKVLLPSGRVVPMDSLARVLWRGK